MAAAVSARHSNTNSPHLSGKSMTSSPRSTTRASHQPTTDVKEQTSIDDVRRDSSGVPTIKQPDEEDTKDTKGNPQLTNAPLAPPPKPSENGDYFGAQPHLAKEPNPFENAFGTAETPGKTSLPGVTSLTSPAPLLPGNTPGWPGSLRSGPLSPAMLTGPTGSNDYFNSDHHFSGSFPTPNESSLRTGLTPGGGGSMFPQPSPNSQALYNQLQSGGATPGTLDFHRTAMTARAQTQANQFNPAQGATSQPTSNANIQPDLDNAQPQRQDNQDPFGSHQTNDAANGLYMLAQAGGQRNAQQYNVQQQQQQQQQQQNYGQGAANERGAKNSVASNMSGSTEAADAQFSDDADTKPANKKGKKGSTSKAASNGKRKNEETPSKSKAQSNNKKSRTSAGSAMQMDDDDDDDDDDMDDGQDMQGSDGKKMTDEEKRKNFLERNRIAALKCRQRKKQWLQNLQQKVEIFSTENDALAATVTQLREEIVGLKTLLLAHKDCPVSQAQGLSSMQMQQIAGDAGGQGHFANPYGMANHAQQQQQMQQQQAGMQRG